MSFNNYTKIFIFIIILIGLILLGVKLLGNQKKDNYIIKSIPEQNLDLRKMKIYIINMEKSKDRKRYMTHLMNRHDLKNYEFIKGVDGRKLDNDYIKTLVADEHTPLQNTEVGCFLSHMKLYQTFLESGEEYCLVLEDDVSFADNFIDKINLCLSEIKGFDIFYCYNRNTFYRIFFHNVLQKYFPEVWDKSLPFKTHQEYSPNCLKTGNLLTTHAMIMSRKAVKQFVDRMPKIIAPIDVQINFDYVKDGLKIYNAKNTIIDQNMNIYSTIWN